MKKFIVRLVAFSLVMTAIGAIGFILPTTPRSSTSLLFAGLKKDSLLKNVESPRLIFVGASDLSFGLNSQIIEDSLHIHPINTGLFGGLGLKYMMENTVPYIKSGDIVLLIPHYLLLFEDYDTVSEELVRMIFEVDIVKYKLLNFKQSIRAIPHVVKMSLSRFKPTEYWGFNDPVYFLANSFNSYGDEYAHWGLPKQPSVAIKIDGTINQKTLQGMENFQSEVLKRGATLLLSWPALQDISFLNSQESIHRIEDEYIKRGFTVVGTPERFIIPDSLVFDGTVHLSKEGADYRTRRLIGDLTYVIDSLNLANPGRDILE